MPVPALRSGFGPCGVCIAARRELLASRLLDYMVELRKFWRESIVPGNPRKPAVHFAMALEGALGEDDPLRFLLETLLRDVEIGRASCRERV